MQTDDSALLGLASGHKTRWAVSLRPFFACTVDYKSFDPHAGILNEPFELLDEL
jgi:hypothetical protein